MPNPDLGALAALRRLRHVETEAARRDLADALTRQTELAAREDALRRELDEARRHSGDFDREAFIAWFARKQWEMERLAETIRDAEAVAAAARTALARREVAESVAEEAWANATAALRAAADRRQQVMLEDVARALKRAAERNAGSGKGFG